MEISFQRAIKINSDTNSITAYKDHWVDPATMDIIETMKGKKAYSYDKETSRKIGAFLRAQIGDYNRKTGIYTRRINGEPYIFTGEEAIKAREINAQARDEVIALEERYEKGANPSMPLSEQVELESENLHRIYRQNIHIRCDRKMLDMVEDGETDQKPYTELNFKTNYEGKINRIEYFSSGLKDGKYVSTEKTLSI